MAADSVRCNGLAKLKKVDIWFPIEKAAYKATEGITTQCESIFLNLVTGNTLEWYLNLGGSITITIGGGNNNSGITTFNAIRIAPGYIAA